MKSILSKIKKKLRNYILKGRDVYCNCCNNSFITFLPAGLVKRANATCSNCGALERHRMVWHFIENKTELLLKPHKLLHSAPELYYYKKFKKNSNINYIAIDKFPEEYDYSSETINMDLTDLKFDDNSFDFIICNHVLEHIPNDTDAMKEMYRVLRNGGKAILNVPFEKNRNTTFEDFSVTEPAKRLELFGQVDHVRIYSDKDYKKRLESVGFKVEQIDYVSTFSKADKFKNGLQEGEDIFFCSK